MIRILYVDKSAVSRQELTTRLNSSPGLEVVGTALNAKVARNKFLRDYPEIVIVDLTIAGAMTLQIVYGTRLEVVYRRYMTSEQV